MSAAPMIRPRTGFKFILTVRNGPDTGATFQLLPPRVQIGRGPECHVVLNDPRVSRSAAVIEFTMEQITITDVSSRGSLMVNGSAVNSTTLKDSDVIQIGESEMTFFVEAIALDDQGGYPSAPLELIPPGGRRLPGLGNRMPSHGPYAHGSNDSAGYQNSSSSSGGLSKRQKFYLIVGVVLLAFVALLMSESSEKKKAAAPKTVEELQKEIEASQQKQEEIVQKRVFANDEEKIRFEEAQLHFNEGFRDFQKGQWVRAMRSFGTAMTIDHKNVMASRYYKLAEKERDRMIADLTLEGRRYREKSMYQRCSAQFEKVLDLIPNKDDMKYKSAEALKKECDLQLEGRFR